MTDTTENNEIDLCAMTNKQKVQLLFEISSPKEESHMILSDKNSLADMLTMVVVRVDKMKKQLLDSLKNN